MNTKKLIAGSEFPALSMPRLGGGELVLPQVKDDYDWQLIVVYRGKHCPLCTRYLNELNELLPDFRALSVDVAAVSADPERKAAQQINEVAPDYVVGYDLSLDQMQKLGLYISNPRSPEETDRPFAEPGLFVVNDQRNVQIVDISNAPFSRPALASILAGLRFIRDPKNNYPVRGTYS